MSPQELIEKRGNKTQQEMADALGVSLSGYKKWEYGERKIPYEIQQKLIVAPVYEPAVTLDKLMRLEKAAAAQGKSVMELINEFIEEGLKKLPMILLFGIVSWQALSPDSQMMRKVGARGRRNEDVAEVVDFIDGGEG